MPRRAHPLSVLLVVLLPVLLCLAPGARAQDGVATDKAALTALYNATGGANWTTNTNWTSQEPLSSWHGVTTASAGRVTALRLDANGLNGTLPAALGDLSELEKLDLQDNALSGALPSELANLTNLTSLLLNESRALTGPLPDGLRELADLETVNIEKTELCAPDGEAFQTWLDTVTFSGLICPPAEQSVIDVAVFYTSAARENAGGTDEIATSVDLMVAETNAAYQAGGANQRINLVAVVEVVGYTEDNDLLINLMRLQSPSDGHMDEIHDTRDAVAADIVLLIPAGAGGYAYQMFVPSTSSESNAFGVVSTDHTQTFAHELGHIMGLHHDRYEVCGDNCNHFIRFPYAFGYVNQRALKPSPPDTAFWRTIMAYSNQCGRCSAILRFSNPDQIYPDPGGDPLGKAGLEPAPGADGPSDAVRMLNRTRAYVANFRQTPDITVSFGAGSYTATEGGTAATVTVQLSEAPTRPIDIPLTTTSTTATAYDYTGVPASVRFGSNDTKRTFTVTAVDDTVDDNGESVTLTLGNPLPRNVTLGSPAETTVTLTDNDPMTDHPPSILSVSLTSDPGGGYAAGDDIQVTVTFSETVEVTGTPQLTLELGGGRRTATYGGGSGTAALLFAYEVADGESDTDGVGVEADTLLGGTIRDGSNNNAVLDHDGLAADLGHKVDGVKPQLAATGGAVVNGTTLTLTYGEALDGSSTPVPGDFTVSGGDRVRTVTAVRVNGSAVELTLDVGAEHLEAGIQVSYTPGTNPIRDAVGNDALGLSSQSVTNETPDTTAPTVSSLAITSNPGSDQTYAAGDEIEVTVTFSETVEVEGTPQLGLRVGTRTRTAGYLRGTDTAVLVFGYEVVEGDEARDGVSIVAGRIALNGGTIEDEADNDAVLDHEAVAPQARHQVDGVRPVLTATGGAVVNGTTLTLTYGEALDGSSTPASGDFTVQVDGNGRTVAGVLVSGSTVTLTLDPAVEHGETGILVSYTPRMKPLRDVPGNEAQSLSREAVTNDTPDTTSPEVSSVAISSNPGSDRTYAAGDDIEVMVTFSETVEVTGTPQLRLELGGGTRTATYEGGTGTAALVFAYEVADGESDTDGVGVEEDSLSGGTIRDEARNSAKLDHEGLAADSGHKVDGVKPELAASGGAVVNGTTLTLTYDEPLDRSSTPDTGDFTVTGGNQARTVTGVSVSGSAVMLTLSAGAEHEEAGIQVSYTPGMKPLRDVPGNEAQSLSREAVTNDTPDTTSPEVSSVAISSNPGSDRTYAAGDDIEVTVIFSETVEVEGTPQLRLRVGTRTRTAGYLRGTDTAALVFGYEVADGDEDTGGLSIEAGRIDLNGGKITDKSDNNADLEYRVARTRMGHRVDGVRPEFLGAAVDGAALTLTYGEGLDAGSRPASGDFTVEVDGSGRSVSGVSISGSVVTLRLNPAVEHGDTGIRVSYTVPTGAGANPIRDAVGNNARALSNRSVTNTTDAPNTAPEITTQGPLSVGENQALVRRLAARDTDPGDEVTGWEIVGGADRFQFSVEPDTGELSFQTPPDYEDPTDEASTDPPSGAGDNEYLVTVEVTSGAGARELEAEQMFTIRVTDEREPPEVPEAPAISGETAEGLEVSWSEPENTGPEITDYDAQYREKGRGRFTGALHDGPGRTVTLSDLNAGTVYEVQVRATNDEGTGGWSDPGEGMTVAPLTLEMMTMEEPPVSGPFTVRFSFSEEVTGFSASDIETGQDPACVDDQNNTVFCDPGIGGVQTADDRVFTTTVTPWTDRVAHSYTLRLSVPADTVTSVASGQPNEEAMLEVRVSPPGAPELISSMGLRASSGSGSVRLNWSRPTDNGGSPIIRYEYRYQAVGEAWSEWENVGAGARGVTVGNLVNGREYVFEVRGVNALGKGGAETVRATPELRIAPPPPRGGGGGGGGGGLLFPPEAPLGLMAMPAEGAVRLEWSPPDSDGGTPILRYEYRLKEGRGEFGEWTPIEDSAPDEVNALGYTVGELGNGTVYVFELRAVNLVGKGRVSEAVEVVMGLDRAYWSNFLAGDLQGSEASLERGPFGNSPQRLRLRFGAGLRFEEDELDGEGEVTGTRLGSYGYRYTSRTTGELRLDYDGGKSCELRLTFRGVGAGSYSYRCGGVLGGQGSFRMSGLNRGPEITSLGPFEVAENQRMVGQLEAVDQDKQDEITEYGIAGGADGGLFAVEAETGELRFREAPDYEDPSDVESAEPQSGAADNEYIVVVEVSSGEGERERRGSRAIRVRVADEEEPPEITSLGPFEVVENRTRVGQLEAVDPDAGDEIGGYGIAGGADGALFAVEATGELLFREAPDYETPGDVESAEPQSGAADNEYIVVVEVRSGEGERERKGSRAIRVRVSDEEEPPEITSVGPFEVVENQTRVGQLEAVDPDKQDEITGYGIAGGADGGLFAVVEETGELRFREAPDYETPGDVESAEPQSGAADNEYIVVVEVRSGEGERERKGSRAIRVRVSDEEEPPEITSVGPFEVVENQTRVGQLEAVDQDKQDEITEYGIAGGADGGLFAVVEETGELRFREAPDYETPGDVESKEPQSGAADNEYIVVVEVRSGEGERERRGSRAIRVRVSDEEEPPEAPAAPAVTAEGSDSLKVSWREPENRGPEIVDYEVRYRESGDEGYSDGGHEGRGLEVRLSGLKEGTVYEVQVRAVSEEGIGEWSEPGEGRTDSEEPDPEEPDPEDPSDFTEGDLEGERLTLRLEGEEGSAGSLELRFGEGNRFEQIESGGEQAATRAEGASRSGSYSYERTGPGMGTVRLAYDDGSSCEVLLAFTEAGAGTFSYDCGEGTPAEGSFRLTTGSLFVPVLLTSAGRNNSFFTSELTLTNRGEREARLDYTYTAHIGGGSGRASDVLAPGMQKIETDALVYLQSLGIAIPETGNRIGTLRVEVRLGSEVEAVVRTTTVVPDGRAGLAYLGVAEEEGFDEAVYLCGLRQNSRDRSNVAFQNMGAEEEEAITIRTTVYSGESTDTNARVLEDIELEPGGFHQYSGLLGRLESVEGNRQGYVRVERVEGRAPFYAYGVINDQANSDGSFVFPVTASSLAESTGQTLPVVVETSAFTSELTVTNFSGEARTLDFQFVAERIEADDKTAAFSMTLEAGQQHILADVVDELRRQGVAGLGSTRGFYAGPLFVVAAGGDMSGIVIGARTGSEGGGGQYSVFYNAVPFGEAFTEVAWVDGLQQNQENRSNLALVNTGEVDGSPSVFHLEIYDGETGLLAETVVTKPIPARRWHQIDGILLRSGPETRQGYIRIEKVSGENPFLAYGVVNDGGSPGERSGDGAYLPARE